MSDHTDGLKRHCGGYVVVFDSANGSQPSTRTPQSRGVRVGDPVVARCQRALAGRNQSVTLGVWTVTAVMARK